MGLFRCGTATLIDCHAGKRAVRNRQCSLARATGSTRRKAVRMSYPCTLSSIELGAKMSVCMYEYRQVGRKQRRCANRSASKSPRPHGSDIQRSDESDRGLQPCNWPCRAEFVGVHRQRGAIAKKPLCPTRRDVHDRVATFSHVLLAPLKVQISGLRQKHENKRLRASVQH